MKSDPTPVVLAIPDKEIVVTIAIVKQILKSLLMAPTSVVCEMAPQCPADDLWIIPRRTVDDYLIN
jgi:hypothetical protein